jgi:tetratricopeptide (TPR) repeat protein
MKMKFLTLGLLTLATLAFGQKVKSQKEAEAVQAVMNAQTPDQKIAAAENLVRSFKDSEFKAAVLLVAAQAAQQKGDGVAALTYGTRTLETDPKNFQAMLLVAGQLAQSTREFDLDKDEKLGRATKLANDAIAAVNSAAKPNPQIPDDQWASIKKDLIAQAHDTLGVVAVVQKKWDNAINEFKASIDGAATPDLTTTVRLASAYTDAGKFDDAVSLLNKTLSSPDANEQLKRIATAERARAEKMKAAKN